MDGKVVEAAAEGSDRQIEATEKVYVPDEEKPKAITDRTQPALTETPEMTGPVASPKADAGPGTELSETTVEIIEQQDASTAGAGSAAPVETSSQSTDQQEPRELSDQKKSEASAENEKPEIGAAVPQPKQVPPVATWSSKL